MCGRYVSAAKPEDLARYFDAALAETALPPNHNVAPTNDVYAVVTGPDGVRRLTVVHWGLIPVWAKEAKIGQKMINARAETLGEKPAFKKLFATKRCIIPADGFYEWKAPAAGSGTKTKQPYFIHRLDGEPLAFAGLWSAWRDPAAPPDTPWLHSGTVITTAANATMQPVHDRMPAMLPASSWADWLDPTNHDLESLGGLLVPAPDTLLTMHPVATAVGNVRNKGAELIDAIELPADGPNSA
jgi:putative SOS response-associated peptidase YedK